MVDRLTRREALGTGVAGMVLPMTALTGHSDASSATPVFAESFEMGLENWETNASIGPEESVCAFDWCVQRSQAQAFDRDWSLEVFTEGDHDDGTAWAVTELSPETEGDSPTFEVSLRAWSPSESFNTLRNLVAYLGPSPPTVEEDFPEPGANSTGVAGAPFGGLREPLHLAAGWREYTFDWNPESVPETLFLAVGVSVVWEADATHYVDSIDVRAT